MRIEAMQAAAALVLAGVVACDGGSGGSGSDGGSGSTGPDSGTTTGPGTTSSGGTSGAASSDDGSDGSTSPGETATDTNASTTAAGSSTSGASNTSDGDTSSSSNASDDDTSGGDSTGQPFDGTVIEIDDTIATDGAQRIGINVGHYDAFGAAGILKNIIPNPGFEAGEYSTAFLVGPGPTADRVQANFWDTNDNNDSSGVGQPVGFWTGAEFEFALGPADGRTGTVGSFTHEDDRYTFNLVGAGPAPVPSNVLFVRRQVPGFFTRAGGTYEVETGDIRPGSPGAQSLRLLPAFASLQYSLDTYYRDSDDSAPKLFRADGGWHFAIWARAEEEGASLTFRFRRSPGGAVFHQQTFPLTGDWQLLEADFDVPAGTDAPWVPGEPRRTIEVRLAAGGGSVLIDDFTLERDDNSPTIYREEFIDALTELQPGILRNWGFQLGSGLDNQLAPAFARRTNGYEVDRRNPELFHPSLPEFLELCVEVGADPWYVAPAAWSIEDWENLIAYLAAPADAHPYAALRAAQGRTEPWTDAFETIHVELGNETWGSADPATDPFAGATFRGGTAAATLISTRYEAVRQSPFFEETAFNLSIGGQAAFAGRQQQIEDASSQHDSIGVAPYYGDLDVSDTPEALFQPLYAHARQTVTDSSMVDSANILSASGQGNHLSIYELNVHTIGDGPGVARNEVLTSLGGGLSLPLVMLHYLRDMDIRELIAYQSLQFSRFRNGAFVRASGLLRDIQVGAVRRPTWLAVELANRAVLPSMITTVQTGADPGWTQDPINGIHTEIDVPFVHSFAFRDGSEYSAVLFNVDLDDAHEVMLDIPGAAASNAEIGRLESALITDDNEDGTVVETVWADVNDFEDGYVMTLQPHSMVVVRWTAQ